MSMMRPQGGCNTALLALLKSPRGRCNLPPRLTLPASASCRRERVAAAFLADALYSAEACCSRASTCLVRASLVWIALTRSSASAASLRAAAACRQGEGAGAVSCVGEA